MGSLFPVDKIVLVGDVLSDQFGWLSEPVAYLLVQLLRNHPAARWMLHAQSIHVEVMVYVVSWCVVYRAVLLDTLLWQPPAGIPALGCVMAVVLVAGSAGKCLRTDHHNTASGCGAVVVAWL